MLLSLEIPTPHLRDFLPLTDFPFGLAQLFLQNGYPHEEDYKELYQGCLLDNGLYELNEPLSIDDLRRAADLAHPVAVVAPDWMGDMRRTLQATERLLKTSEKDGAPWTVGGVVQGRNLGERLSCYMSMVSMGCRPICFPFRTPRVETMRAVHDLFGFRETQWYHLLGLADFKELKVKYVGRWSIDTGKPFKGFLFTAVTQIRGWGKLDLFSPLGSEALSVAAWNIAYLRKKMQEE